MEQIAYRAGDDGFQPFSSFFERDSYPENEDLPSGLSFKSAFWHIVASIALALSLIAQTTTVFAAAPVIPLPDQGVARVEVLPSTGAPVASLYFASTGKAVKGVFMTTFNRYGLQSIGYPLSDEVQEEGRTVQYFERVRMEYHPELVTRGYGVLMTRLGVELSRPAQPFPSIAAFKSTATRAFVKETGHSLPEPFLSYWKTKGGVELFGYPISEPMGQDGLYVQWFERARFEYHPELVKSGQGVQLSLLGRSALQGKAPLPPVAQGDGNKTGAGVKNKADEKSSLNAYEQYVLQRVNEQRAASGLGSVQLRADITDVARARSSDMASRNYFSHTTPEGTQFFAMLGDRNISYRYAGEILARNNYQADQSPEVAVDSYLRSAPHKAIIMDGRYNYVGVGYARASDGMNYFTVLFVEP